MKTFDFKIQNFILYGFNNGCQKGGVNDIIFQSDTIKEIFDFLDKSKIKKHTYQIVDIKNMKLSIFYNTTDNTIINYNPDHLKIGDAVWCVTEGLPAGHIKSIHENTVTVATDSGEIITNRNNIFYDSKSNINTVQTC